MDFMANPKERISKQMPRCLEQAPDICSENWTAVNTQLLLCGWTLPEMGPEHRMAVARLPVRKWVPPDPPRLEVN